MRATRTRTATSRRFTNTGLCQNAIREPCSCAASYIWGIFYVLRFITLVIYLAVSDAFNLRVIDESNTAGAVQQACLLLLCVFWMLD